MADDRPFRIAPVEPTTMVSWRAPVRLLHHIDNLARHLGRSRSEVLVLLLSAAVTEAEREAGIKTQEALLAPEPLPGGKLPRRRVQRSRK